MYIFYEHILVNKFDIFCCLQVPFTFLQLFIQFQKLTKKKEEENCSESFIPFLQIYTLCIFIRFFYISNTTVVTICFSRERERN